MKADDVFDRGFWLPIILMLLLQDVAKGTVKAFVLLQMIKDRNRIMKVFIVRFVGDLTSLSVAPNIK